MISKVISTAKLLGWGVRITWRKGENSNSTENVKYILLLHNCSEHQELFKMHQLQRSSV